MFDLKTRKNGESGPDDPECMIRDLQITVEKKERQIKALNFAWQCSQDQNRLLQDKLDRVNSGYAWKLARILAYPEGKIIPPGSKRKAIMDLSLKAVSDPVRFGRKINRNNIQRFWSYLRSENAPPEENQGPLPSAVPQPDAVTDLMTAEGTPSGLPKRRVILVIDNRVPDYDKFTGSLSMFQYLQMFAGLGLKVIFIPDNLKKVEPYTGELQQEGIDVVYGSFDFDSWICRNGKYLDYAFLSRPEVAIKYISALRKHSHARILYCGHDLHYLREFRRYEIEKDPEILQESRRLKEIEFRVFNSVGAILPFSSVEADIISYSLTARPDIHTVPIFVYPEFPDRSTLSDFTSRKDILFLAGFGHFPNVDGTLWFVRECLPQIAAKLKDVKFIIAGSNPPPEIRNLAAANVMVTGYIKDLEPLFAGARVFVAPLRYGAGIKGKIVQSMYYGVPVVTTSIGAEGLEVADGEQILIADDPRTMAARLVELYSNRKLWEKLSSGGDRYVREVYSKSSVEEKMLQVMGLSRCEETGSRLYELPQPQKTPVSRDNTVNPAGPDSMRRTCASQGQRARNGLICLRPFYLMCIFYNSNIYNCYCLDWIKTGIGNLKQNNLDDIWNSEAARYIRRKMYAGEWQDICQPICPVIVKYNHSPNLIRYEDLEGIDALNSGLIEEIRAGKDRLDTPPTLLKLDHSSVCNLHCVMCSRASCRNDPELQKTVMTGLKKLLPSARILHLSGLGDPLCRPDTRDLLINYRGKVEFDLQTNGLLLPRLWEKIKHQRYGRLEVSVHAATQETYERICAGGKWEDLLRTLALMQKIRPAFKSIQIDMTVMRSNYREIPRFIDMAEAYGFDALLRAIRGNYPAENIFIFRDNRVLDEIRKIIIEEQARKRTIDVSWEDLPVYLKL